MQSALFWTLLALSAGSALGAGVPSSYEDWVNLFKPCGQPCLETMYTNLVGDSCGSNAETSSSDSKIQCICRASDTTAAYNAGQRAGECYVEKCNLDSSDLYVFLNKVDKLNSLCYQNGFSGNSGGSFGGASSSGGIVIPSSNPLGASHTFGAVEPSSTFTGQTSTGQTAGDGASSSWGRVPLKFAGVVALSALYICN